jgi:hypothetical protein
MSQKRSRKKRFPSRPFDTSPDASGRHSSTDHRNLPDFTFPLDWETNPRCFRLRNECSPGKRRRSRSLRNLDTRPGRASMIIIAPRLGLLIARANSPTKAAQVAAIPLCRSMCVSVCACACGKSSVYGRSDRLPR